MSSSICIDLASTCLVCTNRYDAAGRRPKVLKCGHTFCLHCLGEVARLARGPQEGQEAPQSGSLPLPCPTCRQLTVIGQRGVTQLIDNFALFGLVSRDGEVSTVDVYCERHDDEKLKFFCMICLRLLCPCCALHHMSHAPAHIMENVQSAAALFRARLRSALRYCREKTVLLDETVRELVAERRQLRTLRLSLDTLVRDTSDVELLSQRATLRGLEEAGHMRRGTMKTSPPCPPVPQTEGSGPQSPVDLRDGASLCGTGIENCWDSLNTSLGEQELRGEDVQRSGGDDRDGSVLFSVGVAASRDGTIFVTEAGRQGVRVRVLDSQGNQRGSFESTDEKSNFRSTEGSLGTPAGVAVSSLGYLVVLALPEQKCVSVHSLDGSKLFILRSGWQRPFGVAVNISGQMIVTDHCEEGEVTVLTLDWTTGTVLKLQTLVRGLRWPSLVACDQKYKVAVSTEDSVHLYDSSGCLLWRRGLAARVVQPMGIAIDDRGNVVIANQGSGEVIVLGGEGEWLKCVATGLVAQQGLALIRGEVVVITNKQSNHNLILFPYQWKDN